MKVLILSLEDSTETTLVIEQTAHGCGQSDQVGVEGKVVRWRQEDRGNA